jgi:DNA-binding PadR family transcriptional regulator
MHGYYMIRELARRTRGVWQPSPGSVYPALQRLQKQGLVTGQNDAGKRSFSLTEAGRAEVVAQSCPSSPWEEVMKGINPAALRLQDAIAKMDLAVMQVVQAGTSKQQAAALKVLGESRRRLYAILAEDE